MMRSASVPRRQHLSRLSLSPPRQAVVPAGRPPAGAWVHVLPKGGQPAQALEPHQNGIGPPAGQASKLTAATAVQALRRPIQEHPENTPGSHRQPHHRHTRTLDAVADRLNQTRGPDQRYPTQLSTAQRVILDGSRYSSRWAVVPAWADYVTADRVSRCNQDRLHDTRNCRHEPVRTSPYDRLPTVLQPRAGPTT